MSAALEAVRTEITEAELEEAVVVREGQVIAARLEALRVAERALASLSTETTPPPAPEKPKSTRKKPVRKSKQRAKAKQAKKLEQAAADEALDVVSGLPPVETTERRYQPKPCVRCGLEFHPTGPRSVYCAGCADAPEVSTKPPAPTPTFDSEERAKSNHAAATEREQKAIAHIEANPGCATHQVATALAVSGPAASTMLTKLRKTGRVRREGSGRRSEWYVGAGEPEQIAPEDEHGARTDLERKVLSVLNGSGLTTSEVTKNVDGLNAVTVGTILAALARRGVVERRGAPSGIAIWSRERSLA